MGESADALQTVRVTGHDAPANAMLFADLRNWARFIESPNLDRGLFLLGQMPGKYQRLAFRPTQLQIPEDKNDALAFHKRVMLHEISCNFSRTQVF